ncbi:NADP-dependent malic enzyme-like [Limulus polyphemus]|uniref:Malic enzyme n=1 Tax=Limulus polyphemus TaxID=6850 RepID=A0ABM1BJS8_LIMPO|nr:NADP-dependent malic enzyme-like [Limulus polyphemus]
MGQSNQKVYDGSVDHFGSNGDPCCGDSSKRGIYYLRDPVLCKGLKFSAQERENLGLRGLLPPSIRCLESQMQAVIENIDRLEDSLSKYMYLRQLQDYNQNLFFKVLMEHTDKLMPIVYTPTVGLVCIKYSLIFQRPRGIFLTIQDAGRIYDVLGNWPEKEVRAIVVTDGERILGLGDLGANGMGIPVGKLALYTALAGVPPNKTLPVTLDVGTNNEKLLSDPYYIGMRHKRIRGREYDDFIEEFMEAAIKRFGRSCLIQFEDFGNENAFRLLKKFQERYSTFNDDIQGTASVAVAGILASLKITDLKLSQNVFLFQGAGEAALGTADLLVMAMEQEGVSRVEATRRIWMVDSKGLIVKNRETGGITEHKARFTQEHEHLTNLEDIVKTIKPTVLIGASAQKGVFSESILRTMAENNERPVIFALSNPTDKAECTAEQAYTFTEGRCVFASGSPFDPVTIEDQTFYPGQGNNAYIFPGVALAVIECGVHTIADQVFLVAAKALANQVKQEDLEEGRLYPPLKNIRDVSVQIAAKVAQFLYVEGMATRRPEPDDKVAFLRSKQYTADYEMATSHRHPVTSKGLHH